MENIAEKIREALEEKFVGNYIFTEDELAEIYSNAGKLLRDIEYNYGASISSFYDELFFVAIINASKNFGYSEESWQEGIFRTLTGREGSQKLYLHLTTVIKRMAEKGKVFLLDGCQKKYYATALGHAFAPVSSTNAFFDLCWEIFCCDFGCNYEKNDECFDALLATMQNKFSDFSADDEDFKIGSKVYALRVGIKRLAIDSPQNMLSLIDTTMGLFDKVYNKGELLSKESYYETLFENWWKIKESSFGESREKTAIARSISDYEKIAVKYCLDNNEPCYDIPSIRLKDNFYNNPYIAIYINNEKVYEQELRTAGSGLMMATKQRKILFSEINLKGVNVDNVRIEITHTDKIIYNSKKSLNREFILFRENREVTASECLPGNYILYIDDIDALNNYPQSISRSCGKTFAICAENGEQLRSDKKIVLFSNEQSNREMWITGNSKNGMKFLYQGCDYKVFDGDLKLALDRSVNCSELAVQINGTYFKLVDFSNETIENAVYYNITEIIDVCKPTNIKLFNLIDNDIKLSEQIIKFHDIKVCFDKDFYYDNTNKGEVHFSTVKYDKAQSFNLEKDYISLDLEDGVLQIDIPIVKWKINEEPYSHKALGDIIWYKKYNNGATLELSFPTQLSCCVFASDNTFLQSVGECSSIYALGDMIFSHLGTTDNLTICAKIGTEAISLFQIALKEQFYVPPVFNIENGILIWDPTNKYVGDSTSFACKLISKDNTVVVSRSLNLKPNKFLIGDIEEDFYKLQISVNNGLLKKELLLLEKNICVGNKKNIRFKNKCILINEVMISEQKELQKIKPIYIDKLRYVEDRDGFSFYVGCLYIFNRRGEKTYLDTLKNDKDEEEKVNPVRIEMMDTRCCWLVYDVNEKEIDKFCSEFTIDGLEKLSIQDKKTHAIDYFKYEVKNNV